MTTSRERVKTAANHREPDRAPIDLGGHRSSGIMAIAYLQIHNVMANVPPEHIVAMLDAVN